MVAVVIVVVVVVVAVVVVIHIHRSQPPCISRHVRSHHLPEVSWTAMCYCVVVVVVIVVVVVTQRLKHVVSSHCSCQMLGPVSTQMAVVFTSE